ncbi:hypothetical protein [Leucobacter musarum]|uniref:hypothetical protein n=1 Tax=Leucobacter musarum TaxID=1930747 RepID=UPI0006A7A4E2|nr:hypothetical protein [Leucobacter musarum]
MSTNLQNPNPEDLGPAGNNPLIDPATEPEQPRIDQFEEGADLDAPTQPASPDAPESTNLPDQQDPDATEGLAP